MLRLHAGQCECPSGMCLTDSRFLAARRQLFEPVLANRLQHPVADGSLWLRDRSQETRIDQRDDAIHDAVAILEAADHRFRSVDRESADEYRQAAEELLLAQWEQVNRPGNGLAHRLLPRWGVAQAAGQREQRPFQ